MFTERPARVSDFTLPRPPSVMAIGNRGQGGHAVDGYFDNRNPAVLPYDPFRMAQFFGRAECILDTVQDHRE